MEMEGSDKKKGKVQSGRPLKIILPPLEGMRMGIGAKVDVTLWLQLRTLAIQQGRRSSDLLNEAIDEYLNKHGE
jgi:hypothetical protein